MTIDTKKLKQALIDAALKEKGDCYTTRAAFSMRFAEISALGEKGFSMQQITEFLWKGGLELKKDVVRQYYYEHQIDKMEKIELAVKVQIDELLKKLQEAGNDDAEAEDKMDNANAQPASATEPLPAEYQHCLALQPHTPFERRKGVPDEVYMEGQMEHPYVPGLMLSKAERLYSDRLEIVYAKGVVHFESLKERIFRMKWMMPAPKTESNKSGYFVKVPADVVHAEPLVSAVSTDKAYEVTCMPLRKGVKPLAKRTDLDEDFFSAAMLEHPAISGLWLSLEARLYGALLDINDGGKIRLESIREKSFRIRWAKPIPETLSSTSGNFVKMDLSLFK